MYFHSSIIALHQILSSDGICSQSPNKISEPLDISFSCFEQVIKEANECTSNWFAKHFLIPFLTNAGHFLQRIMMMRKSRERIHLNFFTVLKTKERASRVLVITSQS